MTFPSTAIMYDSERREWLSFSNPVEHVQTTAVDEVEAALSHVETMVAKRNLWAVGWVSYEASPAFDPSYATLQDSLFPKVWFALFEEPKTLATLPFPPSNQRLEWSSAIFEGEYLSAIHAIRERVARGDTYQVNYSFRLGAPAPAEPLQLFSSMVQAQAGEYSCFIDSERFTIASASPELFFRKDGVSIHSRPMKGTRPRGRTSSEDAQLKHSLRSAAKDRAENTMIVDMVRNDLSRIARRGSVRVVSLNSVERYPNVFQMTSDVAAETDASIVEVFRALFPPASITGAPKASTMRIISELESSPRRVYTGAVGFISPDKISQFNVAIRTTLIDKEARRCEYGVGSGVVWDSKGEDEYRECLDKATALMTRGTPKEIFETILWEPDGLGSFFLVAEHLERLGESAEFYGFPFQQAVAQERLSKLNRTLVTLGVPARVRLILGADGRLSVDHYELTPLPSPYTISLATTPVRSSDRRLFHKTTDRTVYDEAVPSLPGSQDVILWNERGEITETRIANIVLDLDGELVTPPVESGLLGGCYRRHLITQGEIRERFITKTDLARANRVILINSLRKSWEAIYLPSLADEPLSTPRWS